MVASPKDAHAPALEHVALDRYLPLRWIALSGHVAALSAAWLLGFRLDVALVVGLIAIEAGSALLLVALRERLHERPSESLVALMLLDAIFLVALLYLTGGPHNPLSVVLTVNVAIAAYLLPTRRALAVTAALLGLSALLFVHSRPLESRRAPVELAEPCCDACETSAAVVAAVEAQPCCDQCAAAAGTPASAATEPGDRSSEHAAGAHGALSMALHLRGMWIGYLIVGAAILAFMARLRADVAHRDRALRRAEAAREAAERRAALATLAAGAAHELATPLATVSLASEALVEHLEREPGAEESAEDARTIRDQAARCRQILDRMAFELGTPAGQRPRYTRLGDLVDEACVGLDRSRLRIEAGGLIESFGIRTVGSVTAQALHNVLDNALRAGPDVVDLIVRRTDRHVEIVVRDRGIGMSDEQLNRAGEPFFSGREPGQGMGLGLFVARAAMEELGGELRIASQPGTGTEVTLVLPHSEPT